jgi:hypothetical protein
MVHVKIRLNEADSLLSSLSGLCPVFRNPLYPFPLEIVTRIVKALAESNIHVNLGA